MEIDFIQLKKLLRLLRRYEVSELELTQGEESIKLIANKRATGAHLPPNLEFYPERQRESEPAAEELESLREDLHTVSAPIVGTFYRAPAPGAPPFVEEGDEVSKGKTLCIIEAMKLMNEIEADADSKIVSILCENGTPVEYGMPLMLIELRS